MIYPCWLLIYNFACFLVLGEKSLFLNLKEVQTTYLGVTLRVFGWYLSRKKAGNAREIRGRREMSQRPEASTYNYSSLHIKQQCLSYTVSLQITCFNVYYRIEHLLQGAQDPSKFLEWQQQMRGKDLDQQLTEAECRKLQGKLSYEEAILARQHCIQEKKKNAEQKREEVLNVLQILYGFEFHMWVIDYRYIIIDKRIWQKKEFKYILEVCRKNNAFHKKTLSSFFNPKRICVQRL